MLGLAIPPPPSHGKWGLPKKSDFTSLGMTTTKKRERKRMCKFGRTVSKSGPCVLRSWVAIDAVRSVLNHKDTFRTEITRMK